MKLACVKPDRSLAKGKLLVKRLLAIYAKSFKSPKFVAAYYTPDVAMTEAKKRGPNEFQRTRHDHATETAEDYVEAIAQLEAAHDECRGADLARLFEVSHVTVTKTISRLKDEGLVDTRPYGPITLTTKGRRLARTSRQRHELVLDFLLAIGVGEETARIDAEGIEHHVSKETLECFKRIVKRQQSF